MKKRFRLRREADFQAVLQGRRLYQGQALVALALPRGGGPVARTSGDSDLRVGVAVSRRLRGAVRRNRARRRLREAARRQLLGDSDAGPLGITYDVVLIARPAALEMPSAALEAELEAVRSRLDPR
jgi:ribonuclease P protein component